MEKSLLNSLGKLLLKDGKDGYLLLVLDKEDLSFYSFANKRGEGIIRNLKVFIVKALEEEEKEGGERELWKEADISGLASPG